MKFFCVLMLVGVFLLFSFSFCFSSMNNQDPFMKHVRSKAAASNGCPPQPVPQPLPSPLPDDISDAFNKLSKLGNQSVDSMNVPSVVVSVTYMGKTVWTKGFGVKDKKDPKASPPDGYTIYRIGSVSKIFPVLMLYRLYHDGMIDSLDDPLTKYAPEFKIIDPYRSIDSGRGITLRQMASQLSGLQREAPCTYNLNDTNNLCPQTTAEILKYLSNSSLIEPSWTRPSYSNLAYALIGRLMVDQYRKGMSFEDYAQKEIIQPLGLDNTGFNYTNDVKSKMAVGYNPDGSEAPLIDLGWVGPAGQMYSNIVDLNELSEFFYQAHLLPDNEDPPVNNVVLSAELRREMSLPMFVNPDRETGFGTPWEIMYRGNYTIRTKGGNVNGYSALFSFIPELHIGINALFSGTFDESSFAEKAYDIIIPPFVKYNMQNQPKIGFPKDPDIYTGNYTYINVYFVTITAKDDIMYISFLGQNYYLDYKMDYEMQITYPQYLLPCITNELDADDGEWVYFDTHLKSGKSAGLRIPGVFLNIYFSRMKD